MRKAVERLESPGTTRQPATVIPIKDKINNAIEKIGEKERDRCTTCTDDTKNQALEVVQSLTDIRTRLGKDSQISKLDEGLTEELKQRLNAQAEKLDLLNQAEPKPTQNPSPSTSVAVGENKEAGTGDSELWNIAMLALKIVGALLVLVLIGSVLTYLWKSTWKTLELNVARVVTSHVAANRAAPPDYSPNLSSLSSAQAETSTRLNELNTEVRNLARLIRDSMAAKRYDRNSSDGGFNYQSHVEVVAPKEEPEFPVSAGDYLGKMARFANVVRPDFQNGILVNDPDGTGEFVLIRDSRYSDETQPLFVVPNATQFHTKQDFYTYYQKYYDCDRPSAGDVWIIGPAVVERVAGGWQLREKGMLEIR